MKEGRPDSPELLHALCSDEKSGDAFNAAAQTLPCVARRTDECVRRYVGRVYIQRFVGAGLDFYLASVFFGLE
jgi:hypothetical protein